MNVQYGWFLQRKYKKEAEEGGRRERKTQETFRKEKQRKDKKIYLCTHILLLLLLLFQRYPYSHTQNYSTIQKKKIDSKFIKTKILICIHLIYMLFKFLEYN